jgi:hypothetical protein
VSYVFFHLLLLFVFSAAVGLCPTAFSGWSVGLVDWSGWEPVPVDGI